MTFHYLLHVLSMFLTNLIASSSTLRAKKGRFGLFTLTGYAQAHTEVFQHTWPSSDLLHVFPTFLVNIKAVKGRKRPVWPFHINRVRTGTARHTFGRQSGAYFGAMCAKKSFVRLCVP